jgi:hypothetical protein
MAILRGGEMPEPSIDRMPFRQFRRRGRVWNEFVPACGYRTVSPQRLLIRRPLSLRTPIFTYTI